MGKVTAYNLVHDINQLPKNRVYNYINPRTNTVFKIIDVVMPGGPIRIKRWNPSKSESENDGKEATISEEAIWRLANAISENQPINLDRLFAGSYNWRSTLESLVAYTPQFYYCYPGRMMGVNEKWTIEKGHKHIIWKPNEPHQAGTLIETTSEIVVSELPFQSAVYDDVMLPPTFSLGELTETDLRRHAQIQVALYIIGLCLGYKSWIAANDQGLRYKNKPLIEHAGILPKFEEVPFFASIPGAPQAGKLIDCIWFENNHLMPAVMEIEHSTGVTSGLTRMKKLQDAASGLRSRYVIVADETLREKTVSEGNKKIFQELNVRFFSYNSVEQLYAFCQGRGSLSGVTEAFLDNFMEPVVN